MEHKFDKKNEGILRKGRRVGPIIGGVLGGLPQCGFSTMASHLFSSGVITMGTLVSIFLSTSDEMIPIMLSQHIPFLRVLKIIGFKVVVGIMVGFIIDFLFGSRDYEHADEHISQMCEEEHCDCEEDGIFLSSLKHTLKIAFFLLVVNVSLNGLIHFIGEDTLSKILLNKKISTYFLASVIGLIPNCASSVIMTELYLSNFITLGTLLSGLLTGSGIGMLVLFRTNKNIKENIRILSIVYIIGVIIGIVVDFIV